MSEQALRQLAAKWRESAAKDRTANAEMYARLQAGETIMIPTTAGPYIDQREVCADDLEVALASLLCAVCGHKALDHGWPEGPCYFTDRGIAPIRCNCDSFQGSQAEEFDARARLAEMEEYFEFHLPKNFKEALISLLAAPQGRTRAGMS